MDHLCELSNDTARREALNDLPPDLYSTYERILRRVNRRSKDIRRLVQKPLRWLVGAKAELTAAALGVAISVEKITLVLDSNAISDEIEILRWCSSLVRKSESTSKLELAHFTVKEFLLKIRDSEEFNEYRLDADACDVELGWTCLKYLTLQDFDKEICLSGVAQSDRKSNYSFRSYAVSQWPLHVQGHLHNTELYSLCQTLLNPSKPYIFLTWALDYHSQSDSETYSRDQTPLESYSKKAFAITRTAPLHYATMLGLSEICAWHVKSGCDVDQMSALGRPLHCALFGTNVMEEDFLELGLLRVEPAYQNRTVKIILEAGADPNARFKFANGSMSPFQMAAHIRSKDNCIQLLRKAAFIDVSPKGQLPRLSATDSREILDAVGKESLHERDYAFLLRHSTGEQTITRHDMSSKMADFGSILQSAAEFGQVDVVRSLLDTHDLDVNAAEQETGRTALHCAASGDHTEILSILISHKGDHRLTDASGRSALHLAVKENAYGCLKRLLEMPFDLNMADSDGMNIWHLAGLYGSARTLDVLKDHHTIEVRSTTTECHQGLRPLHYAATAGSIDAVHFFEDAGCNFLDKTGDGSTVLHCAMESESAEVVKILLGKGLDPRESDHVGSTPLHRLFSENKVIGPKVADIVELLLDQGADPCAARRDGITALQLIFQVFPSDIGAVWAEDDGDFQTAILRSIVSRSTVQAYLQLDGIQLLHHLCQRCYSFRCEWFPKALEILLHHGMKLLCDQAGRPATSILIDYWQQEGIRLFAESQTLPLYYPDSRNSHPLVNLTNMFHVLLDCCHPEKVFTDARAEISALVLALWLHDEHLVNKLLGKSPDLSAKFQQFLLTPLQAACSFGCSRTLLKHLIELTRASPHTDHVDSQLILLASQCLDSKLRDGVISELLAAGFDPNGCTSKNETALMKATEAGNISIVKDLIQHKADVTFLDVGRWSVIHHAIRSNRLEILRYLVDICVEWIPQYTLISPENIIEAHQLSILLQPNVIHRSLSI